MLKEWREGAKWGQDAVTSRSESSAPNAPWDVACATGFEAGGFSSTVNTHSLAQLPQAPLLSPLDGF